MNQKDKILVSQSLKQALSRVTALKTQLAATKKSLKAAESTLLPEARDSTALAPALDNAEAEINNLSKTVQPANTAPVVEDMANFDPTEKLSAALKKLARGCDCPNLKNSEAENE